MAKSERVDRKARHLALLQAARDVFAERGYHDAKVDEICLRAKVAKGTYYLYFKDKRAVLEELIDGLFSRIATAILRVDVQRDVRAQVEHNIRALVAVFLDDPALTRILLSYASGLDPAFLRKLRVFYGSVRGMLRSALEEGQRLGIVAPGSAELYATLSLGVLKEVLLEASTGDRPRSREEIVHALLTFLEGGYLRLGGAPESPATQPEAPLPARPRTAASKPARAKPARK